MFVGRFLQRIVWMGVLFHLLYGVTVVVVVAALTTTTFGTSSSSSSLLSPKVYDTILSGRIAVVPNFISPQEMVALRSDAQGLFDQHDAFTTDALASYGAATTNGRFDPEKDRAVLKLTQWKNPRLGNYPLRQAFGTRMADLRSELSYHLHRPHLNDGLSTTQYGMGSTEISYTRFGPGAFLKRHVDEHHEELKGTAGWSQPTRRSISWLIYLNDKDWNGQRDGGQLRCFQRRSSLLSSSTTTAAPIGALPNGDLQIGWLRPSAMDPIERPVYLDSRRPDGKCKMYLHGGGTATTTTTTTTTSSPVYEYITKDFDSHPVLYVAGGEWMVKKLLMDRHDIAERFYFIEPPKSKIGDMMMNRKNKKDASSSSFLATNGEDNEHDEVIADIDPIGATLVLFDSVTLPHEVLPTKNRERWAASGWFHEDQQPPAGQRRRQITTTTNNNNNNNNA